MENSNDFITKIDNDNNAQSTNEMGQSNSYYSVYIPGENIKSDCSIPKFIFQDKLEALKLMKKHKKARFKQFNSMNEAINFSVNGLDQSQIKNETSVPQSLAPLQQQVVGEKPSPFKGPKPQDLIKLKKAIESGNYEFVEKTVWDNPRYLVSSGDTPSILQEGSRYNALHIAAKSKNSLIAEFILNTISNIHFIKYLYADDNDQNAKNRIEILLDLYLNTPDKSLNETPLHFAVKFGAVDVVEVFVSFPQCDKSLRNKFGQTPDMIICDRCESTTQLITRIRSLLQNNYYVPVLRTEDNSLPPLVGEPFSPVKPPVLNEDPLSPRLEIHAYAGPMSKENAMNFRKIWKTPPRSCITTNNNTTAKINNNNLNDLRFKDAEKGLERIGNKLAKNLDVSWKEYWPFLDSFIDISSTEGLNLLEKHLSQRYNNNSFEQKNYLNNSINETNNTSSLSELCLALEKCHLNSIKEKLLIDQYLLIERSCQVFANRLTNDLINVVTNRLKNDLQILENEIDQFELLILSYMDDERFDNINFQLFHSRLGLLIQEKIQQFNNEQIDLCDLLTYLNSFDHDFENNKKTTTNIFQQLVCVLNFIKKDFYSNSKEISKQIETENDCIEIWNNMKECKCNFNTKQFKKSSRNSLKFKSKNYGIEVSRKLNFNDDDLSPVIVNSLIAINDIDNDSDEEFFTPPASPIDLSSDEDDDNYEYCETENYIEEYFIEGYSPTKTDNAVYNALLHSNCIIDPDIYPYIYRWRHTISLYSDKDRERWPCPNTNKILDNSVITSPVLTSTPTRPNTSNTSFYENTPPSRSWLRITGTNSPRIALKQKNY